LFPIEWTNDRIQIRRHRGRKGKLSGSIQKISGGKSSVNKAWRSQGERVANGEANNHKEQSSSKKSMDVGAEWLPGGELYGKLIEWISSDRERRLKKKGESAR